MRPLLTCSYLVLKLFSSKEPHNYVTNVKSLFVCNICITTCQSSASRVAAGCAETDISWADLGCMIQKTSVWIFFCVSSEFYFIWDTKFCSLAAHAMQSSWKRQKMHFQNLPHSPDHLAKPWPLSRGLSEWRWKIPAECSTSEHHFILWSSPDYWGQAVRADWFLPFCLQTAWSSLGFFKRNALQVMTQTAWLFYLQAEPLQIWYLLFAEQRDGWDYERGD